MIRAPERVDTRVWLLGLAWAVSVYWLHRVGALSGWYIAFPWFQNLTHAASASGLALLLGIAGLELGYRRRRLLAFAVAMTLFASLGWELVEYLGWLDQYGVYLHFHDFQDAAVDMASNAVGTAVALAGLWLLTGLDHRASSERGSAAGDEDRDVASVSSNPNR